MKQRQILEEQPEEKGGSAYCPGPRILHDGKEALLTSPCPETIEHVSQSVEVQGAGSERKNGHQKQGHDLFREDEHKTVVKPRKHETQYKTDQGEPAHGSSHVAVLIVQSERQGDDRQELECSEKQAHMAPLGTADQSCLHSCSG